MSCVIPLFLFSDKVSGIHPIVSFPATRENTLEFCFEHYSTAQVLIGTYCTSKTHSFAVSSPSSHLSFSTQLKQSGENWNLSVFNSSNRSEFFYVLENCASWTATSDPLEGFLVPLVWGMEVLTSSSEKVACGVWSFQWLSGFQTVNSGSVFRIAMSTNEIEHYIHCGSDTNGKLGMDCKADYMPDLRAQLYYFAAPSDHFLLSIQSIGCQVAFKAVNTDIHRNGETVHMEDLRNLLIWHTTRNALSGGSVVPSSLSMLTVASSSSNSRRGSNYARRSADGESSIAHPSAPLHRDNASPSNGNPQLPASSNVIFFRPWDLPSTSSSTWSTNSAGSGIPGSQDEMSNVPTAKPKTKAKSFTRTGSEWLDVHAKHGQHKSNQLSEEEKKAKRKESKRVYAERQRATKKLECAKNPAWVVRQKHKAELIKKSKEAKQGRLSVKKKEKRMSEEKLREKNNKSMKENSEERLYAERQRAKKKCCDASHTDSNDMTSEEGASTSGANGGDLNAIIISSEDSEARQESHKETEIPEANLPLKKRHKYPPTEES